MKTLSVGDKVRVNKRGYRGAWGRVGIISKKTRLGLRVEYVDGGFDHFFPSELSPLPKVKKEKPTRRKGKVEISEIRLNEEGKNDDIVIDCDFVHLEQMDNNFWWLGIYKGNKRTAFQLVADQSGIGATLMENGLKVKIVKLDDTKEKNG